ncbi:MAG: hypothetical protein AAGA54_10495 [Myxococcota bacterium]
MPDAGEVDTEVETTAAADEGGSTGAADPTATTNPGETEGDDEGEVPPPPTGLFAFSLRIPGDEVIAVAPFTETLDDQTSLDLANGLEIPNNGIAVAPDGPGGVVYASDGATPRLTEFLIGDEGSVEQGRTVSFEGSIASANGVAAGNFVFVGDTKAYVVDTIEFNAVIFDPSEMLITGTIDLGELAEPGTFGIIGTRPVRRGSEMVISFSYLSIATGFSPTSRIVFVDTDTDEVTEVLEVPDCSALTEMHVAENGDLYVASDTANVNNRLDERGGGRECLLRVPSGSYEASDVWTYPELTGGWDGGGLIGLSDTTAFVRVIDPELIPDPLTVPAAQLDAWYWAKLDLAEPGSVEIFDDRDPRGPSTQNLLIAGRRYATEINGDFSESRLVDFSSGEPVLGLTTVGIIVNAFQVRD